MPLEIRLRDIDGIKPEALIIGLAGDFFFQGFYGGS